MSNNPYQSTDLHADNRVEPELDPRRKLDNPFIERLFQSQKIALGTVGICLVLFAMTRFAPLLPEFIYQSTATVTFIALSVFWYYVFRAAAWNYNWFFGLGHAVVSAFLTPCLLVGVVLIPVLIRGDSERLAERKSDVFS